jgi:hypothetical protein
VKFSTVNICQGSRFAVALLHLFGKCYPLQSFSGAFQFDSDWLKLVGAPQQPTHAITDGYKRPSLPIDCDVLRMTMSLPPDDSNYDLYVEIQLLMNYCSRFGFTLAQTFGALSCSISDSDGN